MKTVVVPYNYTEDLEAKTRTYSNTEYVGIESMKITYTQPADTCSSSEEVQTITIATNCGEAASEEDANKQESFYFDISIPEGQHWSVCDGDSLKALIEDFKKRIYMITHYGETDNS